MSENKSEDDIETHLSPLEYKLLMFYNLISLAMDGKPFPERATRVLFDATDTEVDTAASKLMELGFLAKNKPH